MLYKETYIDVTFSGYYEIYCSKQKRFLKFDTLKGCKNYINQNY